MYSSSSSSFCLKLDQLGQIWLFNCLEGCQHILATRKIKISQIKKIVLTNLSTANISGLMGLLSSLSLSTKIERMDIYGPKGLSKCLFLSRKYSQTSFRYRLYVHDIGKSLIQHQSNFSLCLLAGFDGYKRMDYILFTSQSPGPFDLKRAVIYSIPFGPLYGRLKLGYNFILPDGFFLSSRNFISGYYLGSKIVFINASTRRYSSEALKNITYFAFY